MPISWIKNTKLTDTWTKNEKASIEGGGLLVVPLLVQPLLVPGGGWTKQLKVSDTWTKVPNVEAN